MWQAWASDAVAHANSTLAPHIQNQRYTRAPAPTGRSPPFRFPARPPWPFTRDAARPPPPHARPLPRSALAAASAPLRRRPRSVPRRPRLRAADEVGRPDAPGHATTPARARAPSCTWARPRAADSGLARAPGNGGGRGGGGGCGRPRACHAPAHTPSGAEMPPPPGEPPPEKPENWVAKFEHFAAGSLLH